MPSRASANRLLAKKQPVRTISLQLDLQFTRISGQDLRW